MACNCRNSGSQGLCCTGNGTCEKTCVDVRRVFDACLQQTSEPLTLTVDFGSETVTTITSVVSSGESEISNLIVTPIAGTPNSRVSYTVTTPITVTGTNAGGTTVTGTSSAEFTLDLIMKVPQDGVIAPEIDATVIINGVQNAITGGTTVTTNACVTIITKVVANVILVVPRYGYPVLPTCQEYTQDACSGIFSAPVFPR